MRLSFQIARRYLFGKKTTNAINVISGISILGLSVGAAALLLVLSVFNGFEDLLSAMVGKFNPDLKVMAAKGKFFAVSDTQLLQIRSLPNVQAVSQNIEEVAFFEYGAGQDFGILKGVDSLFQAVVGIDSTIKEGKFTVGGVEDNRVVSGAGLSNRLGIDVEVAYPISIFMPRRAAVGALEQPFKKRLAIPNATFSVQQELDDKYVLTNIDLLRELLDLEGEVSALEFRLKDVSTGEKTSREIAEILGKKNVVIKNRYEQDESVLKIVNVEKWMAYAISILLIGLIAFNMVGTLWMMVLEKKNDIGILRAMGAHDHLVRNIFLAKGLWFCILGFGFGSLIAICLYAYHIYSEFGIVRLPPGFMIDRYPISMRWTDFVVTAFTIAGVGLLASLPAAIRAKNISTVIRQE